MLQHARNDDEILNEIHDEIKERLAIVVNHHR